MKHSHSSITVASSVLPDLDLELTSAGASAGRGVDRSLNAPLSRPSRSGIGIIRSTTISFSSIHEHGELLVSYLKARREIFIDRLHWNVPQADGMEFDQYDTPFCRWVVLHEFGNVVAGVRLLPTTAQCGIYSYMLRDAQLGLLPDIPTDALFIKAPVNPLVWEASRFFISEEVPAEWRGIVQQRLFESMSMTARQSGATHMLGIVPAIWPRWARRLGADASPIGAKFSIDGTFSQAVQFCVDAFLQDESHLNLKPQDE